MNYLTTQVWCSVHFVRHEFMEIKIFFKPLSIQTYNACASGLSANQIGYVMSFFPRNITNSVGFVYDGNKLGKDKMNKGETKTRVRSGREITMKLQCISGIIEFKSILVSFNCFL